MNAPSGKSFTILNTLDNNNQKKGPLYRVTPKLTWCFARRFRSLYSLRLTLDEKDPNVSRY